MTKQMNLTEHYSSHFKCLISDIRLQNPYTTGGGAYWAGRALLGCSCHLCLIQYLQHIWVSWQTGWEAWN